MKYLVLFLLLLSSLPASTQLPVDLSGFNGKNGAQVVHKGNSLSVKWPAGDQQQAQLVLNLEKDKPLFSSMQLFTNGRIVEIVNNVDPVFFLTIGKRDLVSQNGWNIFFDKVPLKPFHAHAVQLHKQQASVNSNGSRTIITIGNMEAPGFTGMLEITLYNGSALFNVAAVVSTQQDSTAILYDAGLAGQQRAWNTIAWADVYDHMQQANVNLSDSGRNQAVKYRTIIGGNVSGSIAVFPAPHQYFYPLDEAFNLSFTWFGGGYRNMTTGYGLGIRQDLYGDKRYVPWFNAPPNTKQRLNFFCLLSAGAPAEALGKVKAFTHHDTYVPLKGYKTMSSHFHNEFIIKVVLAGKPVPDTPSFVRVFKQAGIDIVHLAEFHGTGHPRGPDEVRLRELQALFTQCERLSDTSFLLLPGEEPNEFFGGHWLGFFPKPVYWIMSRKDSAAFVTDDPHYGKVYRIGNAAEMLQLLQQERGLAWTAHPRTKGSTGYPDKYKQESFFLSKHFLGAAWKAMPADLSRPELGKRVLDLADDMNNWGAHKKILAEADVFTIEPENEMYAHMNVNYLQLDRLPSFKNGWQPVLDVLQQGRFFSTTGEVLIPSFTVNNKMSGDTVTLDKTGKAIIRFRVRWTFPLQFAELISGDGQRVYRHRINLNTTLPFGEQTIQVSPDLEGRKWVRLEVWDVAANGAFTQAVWLE